MTESHQYLFSINWYSLNEYSVNNNHIVIDKHLMVHCEWRLSTLLRTFVKSSVIGRIYNESVIQYWRSCTPSRSIWECAVPGLNVILCFLWFTNCVLLFDNNLLLRCL